MPAPAPPFRPLWALVLLWASLPGGLVVAAPGVEWKIAGRGFDGDPRLPALRALCAVEAGAALERTGARLGIAPGKQPIAWVLDVAPAAEAAAGQPFAAGRTVLTPPGVEVTLPARRYLASPDRARGVVAHEAVHALLASAMGSKAAYEAIPRWWREGLALVLAGDGETALREAIAYAVYRGEPAVSFARGLTSPSVTYAEAYAFAADLCEQWGSAGLQAFTAELIAGAPFDAALERHGGPKPAALAPAGAASLVRRAAAELPAHEEAAFRSLLAARSAAGDVAVGATLEGLVARAAHRVLGPTARYVAAKDLLAAGGARRAEEARGQLLRLLEAPGDAWRPEALVLLGRAEQLLGRPEDARRAWRQVLEAFGEDAEACAQARSNLQVGR